MKRLLRSTIDFGDLSQEHLTQNLQKVIASQIEWIRPDDEKVFRYVVEYFQQKLEIPSAQTVRDYFLRMNDVEAQERLDDIAAAPAYVRTNFTTLLKTLLEVQNTEKFTRLLKEANDIATKGIEVVEGREKIRRHGVRDAILHLGQRTHDLIIPDYNARTSGDIRLDGQAVLDEYQTAEVNKDKAWGKFCGLNEIDRVCHGIKRGELWIHGAFTGQLKTTFAQNWAYNLVTRYKTNIVYWSLEMPYEQVRRQFYVLHSSNAKWRAQGYQPLDYRKVRDGDLTPEEKKFLEIVADDFSNNPDYCHCEVISPDHEVTMDDIRLQTELLHKQMEVGLLILDHGQEIEPRKGKRNQDHVVALNSIPRDAKRLALHFNHGERLPVLLLWQIGRRGLEDAIKNEGKYKATAFEYANYVEKAADYITTSYLDEQHRQNNTTLFCNLKNRENPHFDPFLASVHFPSKRIYNMSMYQGKGMSVEDHRQVMDAMFNV